MGGETPAQESIEQVLCGSLFVGPAYHPLIGVSSGGTSLYKLVFDVSEQYFDWKLSSVGDSFFFIFIGFVLLEP